ncbi:hypothetical protein [Cupriavidus sp. L7L]|uniref:hypothetical protein n=1 Tax=Cupriavidus sp. L7L TaxID=2546443 RepID=UPI001FB6F17E|nr:hypothetical protein [Cupriavidus sp. L7L]
MNSSVNTGNSDLDQTIGNLAANIVAGGIGAVLGGGSGAATASNTDRFNRQLGSNERALAIKLAKDSGGKYTTEQIENAME